MIVFSLDFRTNSDVIFSLYNCKDLFTEHWYFSGDARLRSFAFSQVFCCAFKLRQALEL